MTDQMEIQNNEGFITGVSLASFLQMLELEQKSCFLKIHSGYSSGMLFITKGELIDAECDELEGLNAAFEILSWHNPVIKIVKADKRITRINRPLGYIILNAALQEDEGASEMKNGQSKVSNDSAQVKSHPSPLKIVDFFHSMPEIRDYFLLNRHGKVIVQSSSKKKMADFITYCILMGNRIGKALDLKGFKDILLTMKNGRSLMVLFGGGMIIGLLLAEDSSDDVITRQIRNALKENNK